MRISRKIINIHALCSVAHSTAPHISLMAWFVTCKMWLNRNRIVEIVHDILFERRLNWKKVHTHTHERLKYLTKFFTSTPTHIFSIAIYFRLLFSVSLSSYMACVCVFMFVWHFRKLYWKIGSLALSSIDHYNNIVAWVSLSFSLFACNVHFVKCLEMKRATSCHTHTQSD